MHIGINQLLNGISVALACTLTAPRWGLYERIAHLALDLTKASLQFSLWQGSNGERRLSTIHSQEIEDFLVMRVKVPRWHGAEDIELSFTEHGLSIGLEQCDRVMIPGYCDFCYSPEVLTTVIELPANFSFYRSFWETTDHIVTIIFTPAIPQP
jgi:hypothetical protein